MLTALVNFILVQMRTLDNESGFNSHNVGGFIQRLLIALQVPDHILYMFARGTTQFYHFVILNYTIASVQLSPYICSVYLLSFFISMV